MMDDGSDGVRLQKYMSQCGIASRRASESYIEAGRVSINGSIITELGSRVYSGDVVRFDGQPITPVREHRYLVLNKPAGYVCTLDDELGRPKAIDLLQDVVKTTRVYNVGRLDFNSSGLLLFTNDGDFAAHIMHPSAMIVKKYFVKTDKKIKFGFIDAFVHGIEESGEVLRALSVEVSTPNSMEISLHEGKNREIRRALSCFGLRAIVLERIMIGPITLGSMKHGTWRDLSEEEITILKKSGDMR